MKSIEYNKLVRDRIPEIIEKAGKIPHWRKIEGEEYKKALDLKLLEEVGEYLESGKTEELADIYEVMLAILALRKTELDDFYKICKDKTQNRGAFKEGIFLEKVREDE